MDLLTAFGQVVRAERLRQGISQERLAECADLHRNNIGLIERGLSAPALDSVAAIAAALGLPASTLIQRAELLLGE